MTYTNLYSATTVLSFAFGKFDKTNNPDKSLSNNYVLSFAFAFDRDEEKYQFALAYPYSYSR